jgi:16S rRNA (guanine1516-N2)-methyltransferase
MLVTTAYHPSEEAIERSKRLSEEIQCNWVPRKKDSITTLIKKYKSSSLWVVSSEEMKYIHENQSPLFFHPSLALIRVKRLINGEKDTLMECSGIHTGDSVLDCTAGMASDAIVFSFSGGPGSEITALESEEIPYLLIREGLNRYKTDIKPLDESMRRIKVERSDHLSYLQKLPDRSIDIIYFDPMFRSPIEDSTALSPLRSLANSQPLSKESITEALRAARKSVVIKEHRDSGEFARLGFTQVHKTYSKIAYGVIKL